MVRYSRNKKKTCLLRVVVCFTTLFLCLKIHSNLTFQPEKTTNFGKWVNSVEMLQQIVPLVRDPIFRTKEDVTEYFSWPSPSNPETIADVTDPRHSSYKIRFPDHVYTNTHSRVGEELIVDIIARNGRGEQKAFGGDFFKVILTSKNLLDRIVASIEDHNDGTYTAKIPLSFTGPTNLQVILIHPSESIDLLRRVTSTKGSPGLIFHGIFEDKMSQEMKECNIWLPSMDAKANITQHKRQYCNFTHKSGEPWYCEKPSYLDCSSIQKYKIKRTDDAAMILEKSFLFKKDLNLRVQVGEMLPLIIDKKGFNQVLYSPPSCTWKDAGSLPPRPGGYFQNDIWQSRHCTSRNFASSVTRAKCLKNKLVVILGDSTIRLWYGYLITGPLGWAKEMFYKVAHSFGFATVMVAIEKTVTPTVWEPREAFDAMNNITIKFSAHGPPLQNGGTPQSMPYIADRLDMIQGGSDTIVAITIGPHLLLYDPSVYIKRLKSIKKAMERLLNRAPDTLVVFKGFNVYYMDDLTSNQCCLFDWLAYRFDTIARNIFGNMKGVIYLDMWDLSGSHYSTPFGLHVQQHVVENEVSLFLSYVCPHL